MEKVKRKKSIAEFVKDLKEGKIVYFPAHEAQSFVDYLNEHEANLEWQFSENLIEGKYAFRIK